MKFYDLDLPQLLPDNIPLNTSNHVEYTGFINEFFLRGFYDYYNQLFNYDLALTYDYSRSCMGLYSRYASLLSSDNQLKDRIEDAGANFYSTNSHEAAAYFAYELATMQIGSVDELNFAIVYSSGSAIKRFCISHVGMEAIFVPSIVVSYRNAITTVCPL